MTPRALILALAVALPLAAAPVQAQQPAAPAPEAQAPAVTPSPSAQEIIFAGKLYSPRKLAVILPYTAQITSLTATIGQQVKKGDVLAKFDIPLETKLAEKRVLTLAAVKDLEQQLATTNKEIDRLRLKRKELEVMAKQNMANAQSLALNSQEAEVYAKQREALQEKLTVEKELARQRLLLARERFGPKANYGYLPEEGILTAPADGFVLWINPELRAGVKLSKEKELFQVGILDPIIIRAQVHEIEAVRLKLDMKAKVAFDSMPGKNFTATVSRIPWAPLPTALQQPSYYEIELSLPNPGNVLKEGLKAQVTITPDK